MHPDHDARRARFRARSILVGAVLVAGASAGGVLCCGGGTPEADAPQAATAPGAQVAVEPVAGGSEQPSATVATAGPGQCTAGAVLVVVRRQPLPAGEPSVVTVHEGGAFRVQGPEPTSGCLGAGTSARLKEQLAAADFTPPPPPEVQCMAMPTLETTVEHPATGRSASARSPCGDPMNPSAAEVVRAVISATEPR